jgi:hypothetical protein
MTKLKKARMPRTHYGKDANDHHEQPEVIKAAINEGAPAESERTVSSEVSRSESAVSLPPFAPKLLALPHGLGRLQDFAHGRQKYPSRAMAAVTALVAMSHFAQAHITVSSYAGLALGEWYISLAPTGGGKQDVRDTLMALGEALADDYLGNLNQSRTHFSAPASQQGLHRLLEADRSITILSDEFAEWLAHTHRDPHKQAALGFAMQIYSSQLSTVAPPFAVTNEYSPVEHPRMTVLATSTAERILDTMTRSQADSGAYNRWVILVAEQERIPKRYSGLVYDPAPEVLDLLRWVQALPPTEMTFARQAWEFFTHHDGAVIEPIKFEDPHLAGRLSEQAIKIAALIALSDHRTEIQDTDLETAYAIRESLYRRVRRLANHYGAMDDQHATGVAVDQVLEVLKRRPEVYRGDLPRFSRQFRKLSVQEQRTVMTAVLDMGAAVPHPDSKAKIRSAIYEG